MSRIIIDDIEDHVDLTSALAAVTAVFCEPAAFDVDTHSFSKTPNQAQPTPDDPPSLEVNPEAPGPQPFVPCPERGTHLRLTDCWMCWSDVHSGSVAEHDVLDISWDAELLRLLEREAG